MTGVEQAQREGKDGSFRLLFVCTGNICRSPVAETLTRHLLVGRLGGLQAARFQVSSAGVQAVVGARMHPDSRRQLEPWGLDGEHAARFVARQIDPDVVEGVDLVLGATSSHCSAVIERFPRLLNVTFGLGEFARLSDTVSPESLPSDSVERARGLVGGARAHRLGAAITGNDDIPDPIGGPPKAHRLATELTFDALLRILDVIVPRTHRDLIGPDALA